MKGLVRALALILAMGATPALAQTKPKLTEPGPAPSSMIWIGNSFFYYNNGMHGHVEPVRRRGEPGRAARHHRSRSAARASTGTTWSRYFRPNAPRQAIRSTRSNNIRFNKLDRLFDVAMMMDCSQCPIHPAAEGRVHRVRRRSTPTPCASTAPQPVFFMSWAYKDKPEMTAQLAEAYTRAGNDNDALVIPAGLAFAKLDGGAAGVDLYVADKRHPTLAGTYLAAAASYAAVFGASPVDLPYTAGLDAAQAAYLQQVGLDHGASYYGK